MQIIFLENILHTHEYCVLFSTWHLCNKNVLLRSLIHTLVRCIISVVDIEDI